MLLLIIDELLLWEGLRVWEEQIGKANRKRRSTVAASLDVDVVSAVLQ